MPEPVSSVFTKFFVKSRRGVRIVLFEPSVEAFDRRVVRALDIDVRAVSILALRPKLLAATAILMPDVAVVASSPVIVRFEVLSSLNSTARLSGVACRRFKPLNVESFAIELI